MTQKDTIKVGDRYYDALTGLPVETGGTSQAVEPTAAAPKRAQTHATRLHASTSKSRTLHRSAVARPQPAPNQPASVRRVPQTVAKSPHIQRFAPSIDGVRPKAPANVAAPAAHTPAPRPTTTHTITTTRPKTAAEIKSSAIEHALKTAAPRSTKQHVAKKRRTPSRIAGALGAGVAVLLLAGYVSYLTMPSISLRVAAAQAGIDASYPQYHPDGYRPGGAITFAPGEVNIPFSANGNETAYTLTQSKSSWDSNAVKEYVEKETDGSLAYTAEAERGITIYSYGGNAAWVNGGVLYTIKGNANLSNDQIRRIATSM